MVRSSVRLPLLYPIALFSVLVYGQMYAASIAGSPRATQQQQQTSSQQPTDSAAQAQQSAPAATDSLPDDPATTAHIEAPITPDGPTAVLDTSMGRMTCGLYAQEAPIAVANFIGLATGTKEFTNPVTHKKMSGKPFYNGTTFHRVIPGFMIQGGDPTGTGMGDPGYFFNDEIDPKLTFNVAGRLAMANAGPNTNGSQFFITVGPQPALDQHYTIFGQCDPASVVVAESITQVMRDYYLERRYPSFGNLVPRDVASRNAKAVCDGGRGVGKTGLGVYLDFSEAISRLGEKTIRERYGNLFDMYERITDENPYKVPMRIYPAIHYTMGGLWVDYQLQSTIPGLFVLGEANFSDHGANRLGASALMQGLSDGYFIIPYTIGNYLATNKFPKVDASNAEVQSAVTAAEEKVEKLLAIKGKRTVDSFHRELGKIVWDYCGMARTAEGLETAIHKIRALREEYWQNVTVPGSGDDLNQSLEKAGRVADFFELAELMCIDARDRNESCGGHFREEYQTPDGEAQRDDEHYSYVAAWSYRGPDAPPELIKEALEFQYVHPSQRSYK